ncbi:MAG: hypothetical protein GYA16_02655 [Spirochaetes bacterium]|nr:hypothetical protein [Spirochaetota bacterium]
MLSLAFSSCPNDTFIFHALVHKCIDTHNFKFDVHIDDVESLNHAALTQHYDITKLSFHGFLYVQQHYDLLDAGAALGFGCGPLVVTRKGLTNLLNAKLPHRGNTPLHIFYFCYGLGICVTLHMYALMKYCQASIMVYLMQALLSTKDVLSITSITVTC